jgi:siroheme synthase-like protein
MHLPLYFDGPLLRCLIIGGGPSVIRKIEVFLEAGATINVIAPQADFKIVVLASLSRLKWEQREFKIEDADHYDVVIIGKEDVSNKSEIVTDLRKRNIPVNICGDPALSTFYIPAIVREGEMTVAVSSGGFAPFLAAEFAQRLRSAAKGWGNWLKLAARFKLAVEKSTKVPERKKEYYANFIQTGPVELQPLPEEKTSIVEWLQILRHSQRAGIAPRYTPPPKPARSTGFMPRSTYAAGYSAVETDQIPPPDEVGVLTHNSPDWEERYAAEPGFPYNVMEQPNPTDKKLK